jgi:hypothetical protein
VSENQPELFDGVRFDFQRPSQETSAPGGVARHVLTKEFGRMTMMQPPAASIAEQAINLSSGKVVRGGWPWGPAFSKSSD